MHDVGDDLDIPWFQVLALATELTEIAGFEVGLEEDLGRGWITPAKRTGQQQDPREPARRGEKFHRRLSCSFSFLFFSRRSWRLGGSKQRRDRPARGDGEG